MKEVTRIRKVNRRGTTRKTHEEFCNEVRELVGNEYTVLGEYQTTHTKILMRHNNCCCADGYYEWMAEPNQFLQGHYCPIEAKASHYKTQEKFEAQLKQVDSSLSCLGKYKDSNTEIEIHCSRCEQTMKVIPSGIIERKGCPYCSKHKLNFGENSLAVTHPHIAQYAKDPLYAKAHTYKSMDKTEFVCPNCNTVVYRIPSNVLNAGGQFACPKCGDGYSFPEKFLMQVLEQLNVSYIHQFSKTNASWCKRYRYDFYLPEYCSIVEVHGVQHYKDTAWGSYEIIHANDESKKRLALENGIESYIEINALKPLKDYIKTSVQNSPLAEMFDLSVVDWDKCGVLACDSKMLEVCRSWRGEVISMKEYAKRFGVSQGTALNYLKQGEQMGLCDFNIKEHTERIRALASKRAGATRGTSVYCHELNLVVPSAHLANKLFHAPINLSLYGNYQSCETGHHWSLVSQVSPDVIQQAEYYDVSAC